jgi:hypothetical protein
MPPSPQSSARTASCPACSIWAATRRRDRPAAANACSMTTAAADPSAWATTNARPYSRPPMSGLTWCITGPADRITRRTCAHLARANASPITLHARMGAKLSTLTHVSTSQNIGMSSSGERRGSTPCRWRPSTGHGSSRHSRPGNGSMRASVPCDGSCPAWVVSRARKRCWKWQPAHASANARARTHDALSHLEAGTAFSHMPTSPSVTGSGYTALLGRNAHGGVRRSLSQVAPCVIERRSDEQSEPQSGLRNSSARFPASRS